MKKLIKRLTQDNKVNLTLFILGILVAIIGSMFLRITDIKKERTAHIESNVDVKLVPSEQRSLLSDKIFRGICYYDVSLTNHSDFEVRITNFEINANNITTRNIPILEHKFLVEDNTLYFLVRNIGTGPAKNIRITYSDEYGDLDTMPVTKNKMKIKYLDRAYTYNSPYTFLKLLSFEEIEDITKFSKVETHDGSNTNVYQFYPIANILYDHPDGHTRNIPVMSRSSVVVSLSEKGMFLGGIGGGDDRNFLTYGILLDPLKKSSSYNRQTNIKIAPKETIQFPLYIAANETVLFDCDMTFEFNTGKSQHVSKKEIIIHDPKIYNAWNYEPTFNSLNDFENRTKTFKPDDVVSVSFPFNVDEILVEGYS